MCDVLQGSVIGPVPVLLDINADSVSSNIRLFADHSIVCREIQIPEIQTPENHNILQKGLNKLCVCDKET